MATKMNAQRITIIVIALVMTVGTLGAYFMIILQNNEASNQQAQQQTTLTLPVDTTAYKVEGTVEKLETTDLTAGEGDEAKIGDTIKVHYKGTIAQTQQKFDSSYDNGEPVSFQLTSEGDQGVIKGWVDGINGMKVGGKRRLVIPSSLAYGESGSSDGSIPANTDLVFEVELLGVTPKE